MDEDKIWHKFIIYFSKHELMNISIFSNIVSIVLKLTFENISFSIELVFKLYVRENSHSMLTKLQLVNMLFFEIRNKLI